MTGNKCFLAFYEALSCNNNCHYYYVYILYGGSSVWVIIIVYNIKRANKYKCSCYKNRSLFFMITQTCCVLLLQLKKIKFCYGGSSKHIVYVMM